MPNWIDNLITLDGPADELERFRQAVSGDRCDSKECRDQDFCPHRLFRKFARSEEEYLRWCSSHCIGYREPFDRENRRFAFYTAWHPLIIPFGAVSMEFPTLAFVLESCDPCAYNGVRYDWYETRIKAGIAEYMRCTITSEHAVDDVRRAEIEIDSIRDFLLLSGYPCPRDPHYERLVSMYPLAFGDLDESYRVANPSRESQEPTVGSA